MTPTVIQSQSDLDNLYASVARDFADTVYSHYLHDQLRKFEKLHALYFDSEADPVGASWPPLAPSTVARKGHNTILLDTGRLKGSLTGGHGDAVRDVIDEGGRAGLTFGTRVPYSIYHDKAAQNRPARRHVGMSAEVLNAIAEGAVDVALKRIKPL